MLRGRREPPAPRQTEFAVFIRYFGAGALHLPQSSRAGWSPQAKSPSPERSNPLNGENLIHQVRELRRNFRYDAVSRRLSKLRFSSVSGGTAAGGGKDMRAAHPHTPRQVRVTRTSANKFAVFRNLPAIPFWHYL